MQKRRILVSDNIENNSSLGRKCSESLRAAAASLAWRLKTGIDLLYVEDVNAFPAEKFGFDSHQIQQWHLENKRKLEELCMNFPVPARGYLKIGSPADQVQKVIRSNLRPELIAVGTRGLRGLKRLLLGSVAEEVIRNSQRPVMVIGPNSQENHQYFSDKKPFKILLATDLGQNSLAAERYALSLSKRVNGKVVFLHGLWDKFKVVQKNVLTYGMYLVNLNDIFESIQKDAAEKLQNKVLHFKKQGVTTSFLLERESFSPAESILREAQKEYSIIIMGTQGRNILLRGFLGSTARGTILRAKIPVLTVHSCR